MSPEQLAAGGSEHSHQVALMCWTKLHLDKWPELSLIFAIPNGSKRDAITANRLKMEGVKSGVSDLMLPVSRHGYHGFFLELKKLDGKESVNQKEFGADITQQGYLYACCKGWEDAAEKLSWYMTENI